MNHKLTTSKTITKLVLPQYFPTISLDLQQAFLRHSYRRMGLAFRKRWWLGHMVEFPTGWEPQDS